MWLNIARYAIGTAHSQKFPPKSIWSESTDSGQILFECRSSSHLAGFHLDHHTSITFRSHSLHIPLKIPPTENLSTLAYDPRWPFHICTLYFNSSHFNQARASNISKSMSNSIHIYILVNTMCRRPRQCSTLVSTPFQMAPSPIISQIKALGDSFSQLKEEYEAEKKESEPVWALWQGVIWKK